MSLKAVSRPNQTPPTHSDILSLAFQHLDLYDVLAAGKTCRLWRKSVTDLVWITLYVRDFRSESVEAGLAPRERYVAAFIQIQARLKAQLAAAQRELTEPNQELITILQAHVYSKWYGNLPGLSFPPNVGVDQMWKMGNKKLEEMQLEMEPLQVRIMHAPSAECEAVVRKLNILTVRARVLGERHLAVRRQRFSIAQKMEETNKALANIPAHAKTL